MDFGRTVRGAIVAALLATATASCGVLTQYTLGITGPADRTLPDISWTPVTGAVAYQVVVTLDRDLAWPIGTSSLVTTTSLNLAQVAWQTGYPTTDRPYFWVVRAYDRNDPQGVLLSTSTPVQFTLTSPTTGLQIGLGGPTPTPAATGVPAASSGASPAATAAPTTTGAPTATAAP